MRGGGQRAVGPGGEAAGGHVRAGQLRPPLTRAGRPLQKQPSAAAGPHRLAERGHVDHPDGEAVLVLDGEQVGVERHAAGEGLRAVDRVEHPAPARGADPLGLLLAEHPVVGMAAGQLVADEPLGGPVGRRDRRAVALEVDVEVVGAEVAQGQLAGHAGQLDGLLHQGRVDRFRHQSDRTGSVSAGRRVGSRRTRTRSSLEEQWRSTPFPTCPTTTAALEPHISGQIIELHHDKHHAAYVAGANAALEKLDEMRSKGEYGPPLTGVEKNLAFHVSGHLLHSLYWENMGPGGGQPEGELAAAIDEHFGGVDNLKAQMEAVVATVQGSGWAALSWEPFGQRLSSSRSSTTRTTRSPARCRSSCWTPGSTPSTSSTRT